MRIERDRFSGISENGSFFEFEFCVWGLLGLPRQKEFRNFEEIDRTFLSVSRKKAAPAGRAEPTMGNGERRTDPKEKRFERNIYVVCDC